MGTPSAVRRQCPLPVCSRARQAALLGAVPVLVKMLMERVLCSTVAVCPWLGKAAALGPTMWASCLACTCSHRYAHL